MATVTVNGESVDIGDEPMNLIQAAARAEVEIPHYCWHHSLSVVASCRMCLVEVGDTKPDGTVAMQPKLLPACQTPAKEGTVVITDSAKVRTAQKATLEYLLLNHPLDCPTCDQAGECFLQDYSFRYGNAATRLQEPKLLKPDKTHIGDNVTLFTDRCVMCTRCVRFTREISGTAELQVIHRGAHAEIDIFPGEPCNNRLATNVVDLCPVGALCSKDFLYEQRVWWLKSKPSVCPDCSTGCSIHVDENKDVIYRLKPRSNPDAQGDFMCDDGRLGFKYVNGPSRLTRPRVRTPDGLAAVEWSEAMAEARRAIDRAVARDPSRIAAVLSPWMTCEEAYLLADHLRDLSTQVTLFLGYVRIEGEDDQYPKDVHGKPKPPIRFTIRAEKCPNQRGVRAVIDGLQKSTPGIDEFWKGCRAKKFDLVYLVGGDKNPWLRPDEAAALDHVQTVILQDIADSPATAHADVILPSGTFAEKDGAFVNHAGLIQAIHRSIHSPGEARPDGRILWELSQRRGLFNLKTLRREIAHDVPALAPIEQDLGAKGLFLSTEIRSAEKGAVH